MKRTTTATKKTAKADTKTSTKKSAKKSAEAATTPDAKYDKPALRERLKAKILTGVKGGRAGQWSARKAQLLAHEYEAAGGGYAGARSASQQHLTKWGEEKWHTRDGKPAKRGKTMARYLPDKAWKALTPAQRKATDAKKQVASRSGKQVVKNTKRAATAGRKARAKS